jgi:hypothetical protein
MTSNTQIHDLPLSWLGTVHYHPLSWLGTVHYRPLSWLGTIHYHPLSWLGTVHYLPLFWLGTVHYFPLSWLGTVHYHPLSWCGNAHDYIRMEITVLYLKISRHQLWIKWCCNCYGIHSTFEIAWYIFFKFSWLPLTSSC